MRTGELLEHVLQQQVEALARFYGWRVYHTHRSDRSPAGFPDLVLVRGAHLIFAELKTRTGRLSPAQREWQDDLAEVAAAVAQAVSDSGRDANTGAPRVEVYVWRPDDFDAVHARLAQGRRQVPASFDPRQ